MANSPDLPKIREGDELSATVLEKWRNAILRSMLTVCNPLVMKTGPNGTSLSIELNLAKFAITTSTISAISGSTLGSGTASIKTLSSSGVISSTGYSATVYNLSTSTIASGTTIQIKKIDGLWIIDVVLC